MKGFPHKARNRQNSDISRGSSPVLAFSFVCLVCSVCFFAVCLMAMAKEAEAAKKKVPQIVFVPHDNRPISAEQTAQAVRELGYEVIMPPAELLGGRDIYGEPEKVWDWLEEATKKQKPVAAVLSSDTLIYGSLVGSRMHKYDEATLRQRVERFAEFRSDHKRTPLYVFGSIMRTPRNGEASGTQEPGYYQNLGADIFRYTALVDKSETKGLSNREKKEVKFLQRLIPKAALSDWLNRRKKNYAASRSLIDLARAGNFEYLAFGRDDNAPYSQTHMESRKLNEYGKDLGISRFQAMAGIDEFGMLMLARAVNHHRQELPFVYVAYNWGKGAKTIPAYSDEAIEDSMRDHIVAVGAVPVKSPEKADLVLWVNTNPTGVTYAANEPNNDGKPRDATKYFVEQVNNSVAAGHPTAVADIAFSNGADNAMMEGLLKYGLLFRLRSYAGWNTATNSSGFALAQGILAKQMTDESRDRLLLVRYLDDWLYQANVRTTLAQQLGWFRGVFAYAKLDDKKQPVELRCTRLMKQLADKKLPPFAELENLTVTFPWNRMFEANFSMTPKASPVDILRSRLSTTATEK